MALEASTKPEVTQGIPTHTNSGEPQGEAARPIGGDNSNTVVIASLGPESGQGTPSPGGEVGSLDTSHGGGAPASQTLPNPKEVRQALTAPLFVDPFSEIGPLKPIKDYRAKTRQIAAKYSEMALWGMIQTAQYAKDPKLRHEAQKFIVTYGIGKPPVMDTDDKTVEQAKTDISDEVLEQMARQDEESGE